MPQQQTPYDLDRAFASELQAINSARQAKGKPPLDQASEMELRGSIESELKAMQNSQVESTRGGAETLGRGMRDAAGSLMAGAVDPIAKISKTITGRVPKLLQSAADFRPEEDDSGSGALRMLGGVLTEGGIMGKASKLLNRLSAVKKAKTAAPIISNAVESAALPAGLTALEGGSGEEVKKSAMLGGAVGGGVPLLLRAAKKPLDWLTRSEYSFDKTNPSQARAMEMIMNEVEGGAPAVATGGLLDKLKARIAGAKSGFIGKNPEEVSAAMRPKVDEARLAKTQALDEFGGPISAGQLDEMGNKVIDKNFSVLNAKKPSKGGPTVGMPRSKKSLGKFESLLAQLDQSVLAKFPNKRGTPGPFTDPAAGRGVIPRSNMLLRPNSIDELAQETKRLRDTETIPRQKTSIAAPTHSDLMKTNPAYSSAEMFRKQLTSALADSADTPEGKAAIQTAYRKFSDTLEANNIATKAARPGKTRGGATLSGAQYRQAIAASSLAGAVAAFNSGNGSMGMKLLAFAAATGAPRASGMAAKNTMKWLGKPKTAGTIPMLLRRMEPSTEEIDPSLFELENR